MSEHIKCIICESTKCLRPVNEIFSNEGMVCTYLDALFRCFNIQFLDDHGNDLNRICGRCVAKLHYCCAFRKDVEAAHKRQYQIIDTVGNLDLKCEWNDKTKANGNKYSTRCSQKTCKDEDEKYLLFDHNINNGFLGSQETCKMEVENSLFVEGENADYPDDDFCNYLESFVDDCRMIDSPYHSDWSVDTDHILQATGYWKELEQSKFKYKSYKIDQSLCDVCGKKFCSRRDLHNHIKIHSGIGLKCSDCNKVYYNKRDLSYHIKTRHLGIKTRKCGVCGLRFANLSGKRKHLLEVHQKKTLRCLYCVKTFETRPEARKHIKDEHMDVSRFNCVECDLVFLANPDLQAHMVVHTGIRNHVCEICSKSFARVSNLKQHMKSHNKVDRKKDIYCNEPSVVDKKNVWPNTNFI